MHTAATDIHDPIEACLAHAADLLQAAEQVMKGKQHHIAYHLAVIAMEEIGKATLVAFDTESSTSNRDVEISFRQYDDHEKKLFWALFVPLMIHTVGDPKGIDALRDAATALHGKRLDSMYVSVSGQSVGQLPRGAVTEEETSALIDLVAFRLEVGVVRRDPGQIPVENRDLFAWWDKVFDEPDARRNIFSRASLDKLSELRDVGAWMHWLKAQYDEAACAQDAIVTRELARQPAADDETPKWEIKWRLNTPTHSVRRGPLRDWAAKHAGNISYERPSSDNASLDVLVRVPSTILIGDLPGIALQTHQAMTIALCVASHGVFWPHRAIADNKLFLTGRDIENEASFELQQPTRSLPWGRREAVTLRHLEDAALVYGGISIARRDGKTAPFAPYLAGVGMLMRDDVLLKLAIPAAESFLRVIQTAHTLNDGAKPYAPLELMQQFAEHAGPNEPEIASGQAVVRAVINGKKPPEATPFHAGLFKLLADRVLLTESRKLLFDTVDAERGDPSA